VLPQELQRDTEMAARLLTNDVLSALNPETEYRTEKNFYMFFIRVIQSYGYATMWQGNFSRPQMRRIVKNYGV
jgi:hypothetical protein